MGIPTPGSRRIGWARWTVVAVLLGGFAFGAWAVRRRSVAIQGIPAAPAAGSLRPEIADEIATRENAARNFLRPAAGLARLSRLYHANAFYREALQCYVALETLEPCNARWPHLHAAILAGFGRSDEALPQEQRTLALAPDYLPAWIRLGNIFTKANRNAEAGQAYSSALQLDPGNPYALLGLARNDLAQNDWVRARARLEEAVKVHPDFIGALSLLVTVYDHAGEQPASRALKETIGRREFRDLADPWLDELIEDCYDAYRLSVAAYQATLAGQPATARDLLERTVALSPGAAPYRRQLGQLLLQQHEYSPARQHLEKAVTLAPDDSDAWLLLVDALTAMNLPVEAERALAAGLAACPQSGALHYAYGHRLGETGRFESAVAELSVAKKLRPSEANAYVDLALVYFRLARITDGVAEMRAALTVQPGHPLALQVLARDAIHRGAETEARQWIQQLRLQPRGSDADLATILGEFQQRFGGRP